MFSLLAAFYIGNWPPWTILNVAITDISIGHTNIIHMEIETSISA